MCPISPKRGFRPLTLIRGAGYAIDKKGKLVTVHKNLKKSWVYYLYFSFFKHYGQYHLNSSLGKVRDIINADCLSTRCYNYTGNFTYIMLIKPYNNQIRQVYLSLLYKWERRDKEINNTHHTSKFLSKESQAPIW